MTDQHLHDQHLNDEQLSAHLDGEGHDAVPAADTETVEAHLATCGDCRRRLEALGQARALLRQPVVPVAPSLRAAAVQAAITDGLAGAGRGGGAPTPSALHPRRPLARMMVGAAAAVAVLVVAVGVSLGLSHATSSSPSASATRASTLAPHRTPSAPAASSTAPPFTALGSLSSPSVLKARLTPLLPTSDFNLQGQAAQDAPESAAAPAHTSSTTAAAVGKAALSAVTPCLAPAQQAAGSKASVVLVATATYEHQAALVVVSTLPATAPGGPARVAVVVARTGCRVLERTNL